MKTNELISELASRPRRPKLRWLSFQAGLWLSMAFLINALMAWHWGMKYSISFLFSHARLWLDQLLFLIPAILSMTAALTHLRPDLDRSARFLGILAALSVLPLLSIVVFELLTKSNVWQSLRPSLEIACFDRVFGLSVLPTALLGLILSRGAVFQRAKAGFLAATSASWFASWAVTLACPSVNPAHVLVFHLVPVWLIALLGAVLARWMLPRI